MNAQMLNKQTYISTGKEEANFEILTPELAHRLLENQRCNRSVLLDNLAGLYISASQGTFVTGASFIATDTNDQLINGQHTCLACILSNQPLKVLIARNISPKAQTVMDTGAKRAIQGQMQLKGVKQSSLMASICRPLYELVSLNTVVPKKVKCFIDPVVDFFFSNEDKLKELSRSLKLASNYIPVTSLIRIHAAIEATESLEDANKFINGIAKPYDENGSIHKLKLLERIRKLKDDKVRLDPTAYCQLVYSCFRAEQTNTRLDTFHYEKYQADCWTELLEMQIDYSVLYDNENILMPYNTKIINTKLIEKYL